MPTHGDFTDISYQAAVFVKRYDFRKPIILRELLMKFGDTFDGDPEIFPWGEDVPDEIPRIQLRSSDENWRIQIAKARVDLFADATEITRELFYPTALEIFEAYKTITNGQYGRIAAVTKRFFETEDPGKTLARHFCKEEWMEQPLRRPEDFKLHAYKQYNIDETIPRINSWIRHNVGEIQLKKVGKRNGIIVEQDLNTPADIFTISDFMREYIDHFFKVIPGQMDEILKLYYPEGQQSGR